MAGVQNRQPKTLAPLVRLDDVTLIYAARRLAKAIQRTCNARGGCMYVVIHARAVYALHDESPRAEGLWIRRDAQRVGCYATGTTVAMVLDDLAACLAERPLV